MLTILGRKMSHVKRLCRGKDKELTTSVLITFGTPNLPDSVKMFYQLFRVRMFVPPVIRCYNCQRFGHVAGQCKNTSPVCARCGENHKVENCESAEDKRKCSNCGGEHSSAYKGCNKYKEAVSVQKIRVENKISYAEATRLVKANPPGTAYSDVVKAAKAGAQKAPDKVNVASTSRETDISAPVQTLTSCACQCQCNNRSRPNNSAAPDTPKVTPVRNTILDTSPQTFLAFLFEVIAGCFNATGKEDQITKIIAAAHTHLGFDVSRDILSALHVDKPF